MEKFQVRRSCRNQRQSRVCAGRDEHRDLHIHAVLSVPRFENGSINSLLFQSTLVAMGVATSHSCSRRTLVRFDDDGDRAAATDTGMIPECVVAKLTSPRNAWPV